MYDYLKNFVTYMAATFYFQIGPIDINRLTVQQTLATLMFWRSQNGVTGMLSSLSLSPCRKNSSQAR